MSILETIPVRDGLVFALVPAMRSLLDVSGNGRNPSVSAGMEWVRANGVETLRASGSGLLTVPNDAALQAVTDSTVFVAADIRDVLGSEAYRVFNKRDAGGAQYEIAFLATNKFQIYDGLNFRTATFPAGDLNGKKSFYIAAPSGGIAEVGLDGVAASAFSGVSTFSGNTADLVLMNLYTGTQPWPFPTKALLWYSRVLTANENALLHAWSESLKSPSLPADRRYFDMGSLVPHGPQPTADGETLASYDPRDITLRTVPDRSGNGNALELEGQCAPVNTVLGRALDYSRPSGAAATAANVDLTPYPDVTISFWFMVRDAVAKQSLISVGGVNDNITVQVITSKMRINDDINNANLNQDGTIPILAGVYYHCTFTVEADGTKSIFIDGELDFAGVLSSTNFTDASASVLSLGQRYGTPEMDGVIGPIEVRSWLMSPAEIKANYQPIARKVVYDQDLSLVAPTLADVGAGQTIPGTDYEVTAGTFSVLEVEAPGERIGPTVITDGDMETAGVGDWTAGNDAALTKETGTPHGGSQVLRVAYTATNHPYASQPGLLTVGKTYRVIGWARSDGTAIPRVADASVYVFVGTTSTAWQWIDVTFVAAGTDVWFMARTTGAGHAEFDDMQVIPVQPDRKLINCVADGDHSRIQPFAYGTWHFGFRSQGDTDTRRVYLMTDARTGAPAVGGYSITFYAASLTLALQSFTPGATTEWATAAGYIEHDVYYEVWVTRDNSGVFTTWIKGGTFTAWTLVDVSGGSGTNPVTENTIKASTYRVVNADGTGSPDDQFGLDRQYHGAFAP